MKKRYTCKHLCLIICLILFTGSYAIAATRTATTNGSWTAPATWGGTVPVSGDNVVIPSGISVSYNATNFVTGHPYIDISGTLTLSPGLDFTHFEQTVAFRINNGGKLVAGATDQNFNMAWGSGIMTIEEGKKLTVFIQSGGQFQINALPLNVGEDPYWELNFALFTTSPRTTSFSIEGVANDGQGNAGIIYNGSGISDPIGVLPVGLGSLSASLKSGKLQVDWTTLSEANNSRFLVQASADGSIWHELGTVTSKASGGNSSGELAYSFVTVLGGTALAGFGLLGLLLLPATRNRLTKAMLLLLVLCAVVSCAKDEMGDTKLEVLGGGKGQVYVRLAQIDRDGTVNYSDVVLARR